MVRGMPGESPGRNWDALLQPPPESFVDAIAAARARHQRKMRSRAWTAFVYVFLALTFVGWLLLMPFALNPPVLWAWLTGSVWLVVLLPAMIFASVVILRRLERLVLPSAERELEGES
jgi:membrane-bound metal-dependent hydrolase YbcI (DUF457 family)